MQPGELMDSYREEVFAIIDAIHGEKDSILAASSLIAAQIKADRLIHIYGPGGHSNLAAMEIFFRAGGLMHVNAMLNQETMLNNGGLKSMHTERLPGYGCIIVNDYGIGTGDLLIVANAYGINAATIDSALQAKENGATVIGVSSRGHADATPADHVARHPTAKNLHDIVDCHVDSKIQVGDAVLDIPGFEQKVGALSTFANAYALNCMVIETINLLVDDGVKPPVWMSGNASGGDAWNRQFMERFRGRIRCL